MNAPSRVVLALTLTLALTACDASSGTDATILPIATIDVAGLARTSVPPNVFVEIQNAAGQTIWRSGQYVGVDVNQTLTFPVNVYVEVGGGAQSVQVAVFSFEQTLTASELLVRSQPFTADQLGTEPMLALPAATGTGQITVRRRSATP